MAAPKPRGKKGKNADMYIGRDVDGEPCARLHYDGAPPTALSPVRQPQPQPQPQLQPQPHPQLQLRALKKPWAGPAALEFALETPVVCRGLSTGDGMWHLRCASAAEAAGWAAVLALAIDASPIVLAAAQPVGVTEAALRPGPGHERPLLAGRGAWSPTDPILPAGTSGHGRGLSPAGRSPLYGPSLR